MPFHCFHIHNILAFSFSVHLCLSLFASKVRKGFWKPPPQIWLGDVNTIRVLDPHFLHKTAEKLLKILPQKGKQVRGYFCLNVKSVTRLLLLRFHLNQPLNSKVLKGIIISYTFPVLRHIMLAIDTLYDLF